MLTHQEPAQIAKFDVNTSTVTYTPAIPADYDNYRPIKSYEPNAGLATQWTDDMKIARGATVTTTAGFVDGKVRFIAKK